MGNGPGYERKRANLTIAADPPPRASTSTAFARHGHAFSSPVTLGFAQGPRSPSPPASSYFPLLSADPNNSNLRPTADADAHFAYSTTFRRHQVDSSLSSPAQIAFGAHSLWSKVLSTITGDPSEQDRLESGRVTPGLGRPEQSTTGTASEKFAHTSVDVRITYSSFYVRIESLQ